jgi:hypothetical protein
MNKETEMANSRTKVLIPMLALCIFAVSAYGQAVLTLGSNPTRVRTEGITEVVGLITLSNNTNAAQVIPGGTTIAIVYDGTITNNPGISDTAVGAAPVANIYSTGVTAVGNSSGVLATNGMTVTRSGTSLQLAIPAAFVNNGTGTCAAGTPPATATTFCLVAGGSLNIQGVRVNVSGLTGNVFATLTTVPANAVTFPGGNNATVIGRAQATIGGVTVVGAPALPQCAFPVTPTLTAAGAAPATFPAAVTGAFGVNIVEPANFPTSFSAAVSTAGPYFFDEAGITPAGFQGTTLVPTKGVQFVLTFAGIPAGITLIAPPGFANTGGTATATVALPGPNISVFGAGAINMARLNADGTYGTPAAYTAFGAQLITVTPSGGAATVTYEVQSTGAGLASASPTTVDTVSLVFYITAPTGTIVPVGSLGTVQVSVGPVSTVTGVGTAGVTTSLRFVANAGVPATPIAIGSASACLTNLLFPFVSNRAGTTFNTGMAIANTAKDSGTTIGETGGVTLYFYGISAPTGGSAGIAMPIPSVSAGGTVATSGVVAPGEHTVLALNDGTATAIASGFQGYIVALCNFRYAHGLATVFDNFGVGAANVGFSYLPLVINGTGTGRTGPNNVAAGTDATGLNN